MVQIGQYKMNVGMTRQGFIDANSNVQTADKSNLGIIFDAINNEKDKETGNIDTILSQNEIDNYGQTQSSDNNINPKYQRQKEKLQKKIDDLNEQVRQLEEQAGELEKFRTTETSEKTIQDLNNQIKKLENKRTKLLNNISKDLAKLYYLNEVKIDGNISDSDLAQKSQQYMEQRNQMNPYYKKYMEIVQQFNTETDPAKKAKLEQQFRIYDQLVANWHPAVSSESETSNSQGIKVSTNIQGSPDNHSENLNVNGSIKNGNNTYNANAGYTTSTDEENNVHSENITAGGTYTRALGEHSSVSAGITYLHYNQTSPDFNSHTNTVNSNVGFYTNPIGNLTLSGNYNNTYSHTTTGNDNFSSSGHSISHSGSLNGNYQLGHLNFGAGASISHTKSGDFSQTSYNAPLSVTYGTNSAKHNNWTVSGSFTPEWTNNGNRTMSYGLNTNYTYSNDSITLNNNTNLGYSKSNLAGENYSFNNSTTLTNNKYGIETGLNFTGNKSKYSKTLDAAATFTAPMNESRTSSLTIGIGHNNESGTYGQIGMSFSLNPRKRHK